MMGEIDIKKEIHDLVEEIDNKEFLVSMFNMLKELKVQPQQEGEQSINLMEHLEAFIKKNDGLLKRLAQ